MYSSYGTLAVCVVILKDTCKQHCAPGRLPSMPIAERIRRKSAERRALMQGFSVYMFRHVIGAYSLFMLHVL